MINQTVPTHATLGGLVWGHAPSEKFKLEEPNEAFSCNLGLYLIVLFEVVKVNCTM